jgi:hypothetical protein
MSDGGVTARRLCSALALAIIRITRCAPVYPGPQASRRVARLGRPEQRGSQMSPALGVSRGYATVGAGDYAIPSHCAATFPWSACCPRSIRRRQASSAVFGLEVVVLDTRVSTAPMLSYDGAPWTTIGTTISATRCGTTGNPVARFQSQIGPLERARTCLAGKVGGSNPPCSTDRFWTQN